MEMWTTYADHISRTGSLVPPRKLVNVKPNSQIIDHSACPIRFTVANIGEYELENLYLFINIETPNVMFAKDDKVTGVNFR